MVSVLIPLGQIMRFFRHVLFYFCVVLIALLTHPANAERRVAFVVGNGDYRHATKLPNPSADANAAALLRNVGFEVIEGLILAARASPPA